jgi:hypothetical protein
MAHGVGPAMVDRRADRARYSAEQAGQERIMTYAQGWSGEPGQAALPVAATTELKTMVYPNRFERTVRVIRDLLACLALLLASALMVLFLTFVTSVAHRLDQVGTDDPAPDPAVTGCPFGDGECGG